MAEKQYRCPLCNKIFTEDNLICAWGIVFVPIVDRLGSEGVCRDCFLKKYGDSFSEMSLIEESMVKSDYDKIIELLGLHDNLLKEIFTNEHVITIDVFDAQDEKDNCIFTFVFSNHSNYDFHHIEIHCSCKKRIYCDILKKAIDLLGDSKPQ